MAAASTCPVCLGEFSEPAKFALHVAGCVSLQPLPPLSVLPPPPAAKVASCPYCHKVYTSDVTVHHIEFHEEECELHNEKMEVVALPAPSAKTARLASGTKRSREATETVVAKAPTASTPAKAPTAPSPSPSPAPPVAKAMSVETISSSHSMKLFPSFCAVCEGGGRTLLKCAGKCARSFHPLCIEEINARDAYPEMATAPPPPAGSYGTTTFATAITRNKKAQRDWLCGECARGLHPCQLCGFLGHETQELIQCSLPGCGFFFHVQCLRDQNYRVRMPLVCPRHTCTGCHAIETNMATCYSCTKCCTMQHLHCRDAASSTGAAGSTRTRGDVSDTNFYVCDSHKAPTETKEQIASRLLRKKYTTFSALKMNITAGDVVLLLEYNNLLLPDTAKEVAPAAYNHWGLVQQVEQLGHGISPGWWTQLLTVTLFADNSMIDVPNRYVLPVSSMRQYKFPVKMIRESIKWHTMAELQVRALEDEANVEANKKKTLAAAVTAFKGRADALGLAASDCAEQANTGFTAWKAYASAASKTQSSTGAPVFIALDTRGRVKPSHQELVEHESSYSSSSGRNQEDSSAGDGDVDMEDASGGSSSSSASTTKSSAPTNTDCTRKAASLVDDDVILTMERVLEKVTADFNRGRLLGGALDGPVDDDDEDVIVDDIGPDEDEEMRDGSSDQQRLSIDDLLNPSSQDPLLSPPVAPQRTVDHMYDEETKESGSPRAALTEREVPAEALDLDNAGNNRFDVDETKTAEPLHSTSHDHVVNSEPPQKKPKLHHFPRPPVAVKFSHVPVDIKPPRSSVFGRAPIPVPAPLLRKEKAMAQMPSVVVKNLQSHVDAFFSFEEGDESTHYPSFRPAFYRPSPFLYRGPRVGRRVDGISRVLLCQDKRDLKCFVREALKSSQPPSSRRHKACRYGAPSTGSRLCVTVDLMGIPNFTVLEHVVRGRVASVVTPAYEIAAEDWRCESETGTDERFPVRAATPQAPEIRLSYCAYDGSEHILPNIKSRVHSLKHQPEWLCFCANVVHLTASIVNP